MAGWKEMVGKKVFVILRDRREFTGIVLEANEVDSERTLILILDKFGKHVGFMDSEISLIKEEGK
jgi:hypothetical protein